MRRFLAGVLLAISAIGSSATASSLVFLHVAVIDVRKGSTYRDMAVIVIDTRISAVIPASQFKRNPKDRVIDSTGKFLIPGLWDMHLHLVQGSNGATVRSRTLPLLIANGVIGVRHGGRRAATERSQARD
jgi:imidazolonepropionase-like amidohydrolase